MKYTTENEFEHFDFSETHIKDIELGNDYFHIWLDDVKILPENSCNRDIRTMRANNLMLSIHSMKITSFIREGVKIYDANGVPTGERQDEKIGEDEYENIFPLFLEGNVYSVTKGEKEGRSTYDFVVDAEDGETYDVSIEGDAETESWDKFLNLESM